MAKLNPYGTGPGTPPRKACEMVGGYCYATECDMECHLRTAVVSTVHGGEGDPARHRQQEYGLPHPLRARTESISRMWVVLRSFVFCLRL
jgi:hypothetical protein